MNKENQKNQTAVVDITVEAAINELRFHFIDDSREPTKSTEKDGVFAINQAVFPRQKVVAYLRDFFTSHRLTDGECAITHGDDLEPTEFVLTKTV